VTRLPSYAACLAVAAALLVAAPRAHAQEGVGSAPKFGENATGDYRSSQWFAFELKFGPYSPNIDASPGLNGATPFADLFPPGKGKTRPPGRLLTQVEFDFQFLHKPWGNFGVGHSIGYYRRTTHAFAYNTNPTTGAMTEPCMVDSATNPCARTGDTTALNIVPMSLLAVYRFDYLAKRYRIPFVPYFKIGIAYYAWWIENGGGFLSVSKFQQNGKTDSGYGGTWGWVMNPGGAFLLDVLDPGAARTMDAELGINHTYLFCELHYADITNFGSGKRMNLSDTTLNAGLAFEF
jgi:hypothetical protein